MAVYDLNLGQRVPVTLTNVLIVAAGGVWAEGLAQPSPVPCPDPLIPGSGYQVPGLTIEGSVITGHAGATSLLYDCDTVPGTEAIVAGYERFSRLPSDEEQWATADIERRPGRDQGAWRRR